MLLQWVQRNAAHFGGTPHAVTVWGEGTGAACLSALAADRSSWSLFHVRSSARVPCSPVVAVSMGQRGQHHIAVGVGVTRLTPWWLRTGFDS